MTEDLLRFIANSPTAFHAVENIASILRASGYTLLSEGEPFRLSRGGKYFVTRGGRSLVAFRIPASDFTGYQIAAAHLDSPTFRLKPCPTLTGDLLRLSTERYGGMNLASFCDRPLGLAGRAVLRTEAGLVSRLFDLCPLTVVIPSVAMHLTRTSENKPLSPAVDMQILYGKGEPTSDGGDIFLRDLAQALGCDSGDILSHETYAYVKESGRTFGRNGEFLLSPRLDDLMCAYPLFTGFLSAPAGESLPVLALFDAEEIGSGTHSGADSDFLISVLARIARALNLREPEEKLAHSFLLSADNAHARHPNHPELSDPGNAPALNAGIVLKYNAGGRYITDAVGGGYIKALCDKTAIPSTTYSNRSDIPGGSTLGHILLSHLSLTGADIGLAQLAMHAAVEAAGAEDAAHLASLAKVYFSDSFRPL